MVLTEKMVKMEPEDQEVSLELLVPQVLTMEPGALVLFRGRNSVHRVSPNESDVTRMLAVLAYNAEPGVALSASARQTFYGRLG